MTAPSLQDSTSKQAGKKETAPEAKSVRSSDGDGIRDWCQIVARTSSLQDSKKDHASKQAGTKASAPVSGGVELKSA